MRWFSRLTSRGRLRPRRLRGRAGARAVERRAKGLKTRRRRCGALLSGPRRCVCVVPDVLFRLVLGTITVVAALSAEVLLAVIRVAEAVCARRGQSWGQGNKQTQNDCTLTVVLNKVVAVAALRHDRSVLFLRDVAVQLCVVFFHEVREFRLARLGGLQSRESGCPRGL